MPKTNLFISVAEQSADEHAASLIKAFRELNPDATFDGLAGPAMQAEGCTCFRDMTAKSAMAMAALKRVPEAWKLLRSLRTYLEEKRFDAAVIVDSPALNLPIAKICRKLGIPVLYYIAPQTWAWGPRKWRNARIKKRVNRLACLWPFEQPYFRSAGIQATYVGHPSFDRLLTTRVNEDRVAELRGEATPVITLLPGSRRHVVEEVMPGQLDAAKALAMRYQKARFWLVAASPEIQQMALAAIEPLRSRVPIEVLTGDSDRADAIAASDLALVASGTITLEVAYRATPMIVMYNAGKWPYLLLGRFLITAEHLSIPNILAGRQIVPEFMPYYPSADPIIARAVEWISSPGALDRIRKDLEDTIRPLVRPGASKNAAKELQALLEESTDPRP